MRKRTWAPKLLARLSLDLGLTALMLSLFSFHLTGLALHEWLGLALCVVAPVHMLVSWSWLAAATRRFFTTLPWTTRITYLLNAALFTALVVVTVTGLVISEVIMPGALPMSGGRGFWRVLHTQASNASLILMGLHIAVYWRTLVRLVKRIGGAKPLSAMTPDAPSASPVRAPVGAGRIAS